MRTSDIFLRAGRNLKQSKTRTILTALAIAVGATTIMLAMAAGEAGRAYIDKQSEANSLGEYSYINVYVNTESGSNEIEKYTDTSNATGSESNELTNNDSSMLNQKDLDTIEGTPGVKELIPRYSISGQYIQLDGQDDKFIAPSIATTIRPIGDEHIVAGKYPEDLTGKAIISEDFTEAFGLSAAELINKKVTLSVVNSKNESKQFTFNIAGVASSDRGVKSIDISSTDAKLMHKYQLGGDTSVYSAVTIPDEGVSMDDLQDSLIQAGYLIYSSQDGRESAMEAISIAQWALVGFGAIALLAASFGIINTQYISVLERTQQIGLMKAVGGSRKDVARLFRYEAAWVGLIGGIIGVGVAYLISLAGPLIKDIIGLGESDLTLFIFNPVTVVVIIALMILIAILSGYFPSRKAAKLDPIEALRTE